jgi:hemolysin activation/secretion protein
MYFSPGNLSDHNTDEDFALVRAGAEAEYFYARGFFDRRWWIHQSDAEFVIRGTGQWADGNLVPPEQLFFGGYNSIRGYDDYAILGDSGYFMNFELWSAPICGVACPCDQLRGLVFYDWGIAANHTLLPFEPSSVDLQSVGIGLRYDYKPEIYARVDYGWQLTEVPGIPYDQRIHVGIVISH